MKYIKNTPMMQQYLSIKNNYSDSILLYRMGDFYEMFFEDAKISSQILEIVLTSRNKKDKKPIPMCGFPHKAAYSYIAKLIEKGHKVAICDQVGDPNKSKGLVERKVIRVITPGMIIDDDLLKAKVNNFIVALEIHKQTFGVASLDISTGSFFVTESTKKSDVIDEIGRISPSEILISNRLRKKTITSTLNDKFSSSHISFAENIFFNYNIALQSLLNQFNTFSLEGFGCTNMIAGIIAASALLNYIHETQKQQLDHIRPIKSYYLDNFLIVDKQSCKNLELFDSIRPELKGKTLIDVLDVTVTSMGGRLLNNWIRYPLINYTQILRRHDAVYELVNNVKYRNDIRKLLKYIFDIERLTSRVCTGNANARDLNALKESIQVLPKFFQIISKLKSKLYLFKNKLDNLYNLSDLIDKSIRNDVPIVVNEGGIIKKGFSPQLDYLIDITRKAKKWIIDLEIEEKKRTSINSLKIRYNKIFGYYIEIPKSKSKDLPSNYFRKQTLVNSERYTTEGLKDFEAKVFISESQRKSLELEIFKDILLEVKKCSYDIQEVAMFISVVDCLSSFASIAHRNNYCRPVMNLDGLIDIKEGRHPVVEHLIESDRFVPNSIKMDNVNNQILIITGPNMAGKSTILRQTALSVIMAHIGSFVPSKKANISITDRIFTRVGALDDIAAGQSTFMVEMQETANILNNATGNSLIIIDEIGRGTSTSDGLSIAWSIVEYLHDLNNIGVKSMFATHYHELTKLENEKSRIVNFNIAAKEFNEKIIFMRKLIKGSTNKSYGIQVAKLAGIPVSVIERSKEILLNFEKENSNKLNMTIDNNQNSKKYTRKNIINSDEFEAQKKIISMIHDKNVLEMTPIEALNYLNMLQKETKIYF